MKFVDLSLKSLNGLDERGDGILLVHAPQKFEKVPKPTVKRVPQAFGGTFHFHGYIYPFITPAGCPS